jgi:hypothetical protein
MWRKRQKTFCFYNYLDLYLFAMVVAALWISRASPRVPQNRFIKSPVVMISTLVSWAFKINWKKKLKTSIIYKKNYLNLITLWSASKGKLTKEFQILSKIQSFKNWPSFSLNSINADCSLTAQTLVKTVLDQVRVQDFQLEPDCSNEQFLNVFGFWTRKP